MRAAELHVRPENGAFPGVDEAIAAERGVRREALLTLEWHSDGSYALLYRLSGGDADAVRAVLAGRDDVHRYDVVGDDQHRYAYVHVTEREVLSELLAIAERHALLVDPPFRFTDHGVRVTVAGADAALRAAFEDAVGRVPIDVERIGGYDPDEPALRGRLTDRQYEALAVAREMGYYETPRTASFEDVADELDCAPSTANELLRRAEARLVDGVLR